MYYSQHHQGQNQPGAGPKHHDAVGPPGPGPGGPGPGQGWRHGGFNHGLSLQPGGYSNGMMGGGVGGVGGGGGGGYGPPGGPGSGSGPHHGGMGSGQPGHHVNVGLAVMHGGHPGNGNAGHPHHPSFGGGGGSGLHVAQQSTGGLSSGHGQQNYGMAMYPGPQQGGGSPPRQNAEVQMPMTVHWQQQLVKAEASRATSQPHSRARALAVEKREANKTKAIIISDPNRPASAGASIIVNGLHKKNMSSIFSNDARSSTPEASEATLGPSSGNGDNSNPLQDPAPSEEEKSSEMFTGLDLGGIRLKQLSPAMFTFGHITALYINHNSLVSLPPSINHLRNLVILDATGNELTSVPAEIGVMHKLKELLLFDNHLSTIPPEFGFLYNLETLGIEGNPMPDSYRKLVAEEGTQALIAHLRDVCPAPASPPERQWITIPDEAVPGPNPPLQETFTALTYNILCQYFAPSSTYRYTPRWALDWAFRKGTLLQEIVNADADVVCLQELDVGQYQDFFCPELEKHGYSGVHYPRQRARTMHSEEAKQVDGCATFWKDNKFSLIETQVVEFNQIPLHRSDLRTEDMFNRVMSRDNIAVVASLEFKASKARLLVANAHIYWDHRYRDVKLIQIGMLLEELESTIAGLAKFPAPLSCDTKYNAGLVPKYDKYSKGTDIPLILCVDTNSLTKSGVYELLANGRVPPDHEDFMHHKYGPFTSTGLKHRLGLRSACASFGEMKMTNFTPTFTASIDYIFYTPKSLGVTSVLGDVDRSYTDRVVGFPNAHFPSDHIPIYAQFKVKTIPENIFNGSA